MLSNPLQRFSPYSTTPAPHLYSNGPVSSGPLHSLEMAGMSQNSHYALQQIQQQVAVHSPHIARSTISSKHRQHPYVTSARAISSSSGPVRRRISRACDQCNQLRTRCDGQTPCAHCVEFGLGCEYIRERKKRGKASRKDLAQQAATHTSHSNSGTAGTSPSPSTENGHLSDQNESKMTLSHGSERPAPDIDDDAGSRHGQDGRSHTMAPLGESRLDMADYGNGYHQDPVHNPAVEMNGYPNIQNGYDRPPPLSAHPIQNTLPQPVYSGDQTVIPQYAEVPYGMHPQPSPSYPPANGAFSVGASPMRTYAINAHLASPGWAALPSPTAQHFASHVPSNGYHTTQPRYPVLQPLVPHLSTIIPLSLACDLIDLYFSSSSSAQMHPMSSYVLGSVFRKKSFIHPTKPRQCQPALLASMLWVAAQTSDAPFLTSVPSGRGKTCQKLLELTVSLLKPLIHTPSGDSSPVSSPTTMDGVALGGLGVALPGSISVEALTSETGPFGAAGTLDDVVTYIHLATVVSASEYKGASLRWWNAAWSLARELRLGRELPLSMSAPEDDGEEADAEAEEADELGSAPVLVTEEDREERRRIWWLVYVVDRHLALCYNRPLFLLDVECDALMQPMDDTAYQNGEFAAYAKDGQATGPDQAVVSRIRGPSFECTGHSIYGYFLPLMAILGEIVDLHHARNHPRFGVSFRSAREWDEQAMEIARHLELYERSLATFAQIHLGSNSEDKEDHSSSGNSSGNGNGNVNGNGSDAHEVGTPGHSVHSVHTSASRISESEIQTRIVMAYGNHVMHVLHILLTGKWDPINLLDDNDLWISSQGFITATGHAVSAAEAISHILEYDPGLEFMPFFFGIYLLQGSFLLLLIADKLQLEASPSVVRACETIIRAHEACVVTLNTEYQRNFSKVMRSALAQVRGRVPEDLGEQHQRRRELLALYRWTGDGTGLAL